MSLKRIMAGLLCVCFTLVIVGEVFAQEQQQRQRQGGRRWPWKGPEMGSEIKDFELPILDGGKFKLSDHRGKIVIIEHGACT